MERFYQDQFHTGVGAGKVRDNFWYNNNSYPVPHSLAIVSMLENTIMFFIIDIFIFQVLYPLSS